MKFISTLLILIAGICLLSCGTQSKVPNYVQNLRDTTGLGQVVIPEMRIQKNDLLSIQVYSASTRPEVSDVPYNLPLAGGAAVSSTAATTGGYLVDAYGDIEYPQIGAMHVEGMTKRELANNIKQRINEKDSVLTKPSVIIRFMNLKISVLGEVKTPGVINFPGERVTIFEALGLAGDFTDYGMKNTVKVIRETDGVREAGTVDLSSNNVFESPYYNLQQNDVVIVQPSARKSTQVEQNLTFQRISLGLSIVTAIAILFNIFR